MTGVPPPTSGRSVGLLEPGAEGVAPFESTAPRDAGTTAPGGSPLGPEADSSSALGASARLGRTQRLGQVLIGIQLVALVAFSTFQYHRFALTTDFGAYAQAWWKISHGQLDPWSSVLGTSFWAHDAEFLMWPLAVLGRLYPHPVILLWVQDLAVAATEVVVLGWIIDVLRGAGDRITPRRSIVLAAGSAVVLALNPWVYETIAFDFHFHTLAALFVVLAGRALWAGRTSRVWWWAALALLSGVLGGLYVFGVGISGVAAGRRTRTTGAVLGAVGLGWFVVFGRIGAQGPAGHLVDAGYAYLTGSHAGDLDLVGMVVGSFGHLGAVIHLIARRWPIVFGFVVVFGLLGVASPWGFGMALVVFVPSVLNSNPSFLRLPQSFQIWPALPFVLVGSVMVVIRLGSSTLMGRRIAVAAMAASATFSAVAATSLPDLARNWVGVQAAASAALARSQPRIPGGAEVIASQGVVGRFADHDDVFPYPFLYRPPGTSPTDFPVRRPVVVFVLAPNQGITMVPVARTMAAVRFVERRLDARVVEASSGVYVLEWSPPPGTSSVVLP